MKLYVYAVCAIILISGAEPRFYRTPDLAIAPNCTEIYSDYKLQYLPYEEIYYTNNWLGNHTMYHKREVCCPGFEAKGALCVPHCSRDCGLYGFCSKPEFCQCNSGYNMDNSLNECKPICLNECENGHCVSPNACACNDGYRMLPDGFTCDPVCSGCDNKEFCVEPHVCRCINGYEREGGRDRIDREHEAPTCKAVCERDCVNGDCVEPDLCGCHPGYDSLDDDPFTCLPQCRYGCRKGDCTSPDYCTCYEGYKHRENTSHICEPVCSEGCINGDCVSPNGCACYFGYIRVGSELSNICEPTCQNDCGEHGKCVEPDRCICDAGYEWNNETSVCAPTCSKPCQAGECTAPNTCTCRHGYQLSNKEECEPICGTPCENGRCSAPDECTCNDGFERKIFADNSSKCIAICQCGNGLCGENAAACESCAENYDLIFIENITVCQPHCEGGCQNGECIEPQKCACNENYILDNDRLGNPVCVYACGSECVHGNCLSGPGVCRCYFGWSGKFCDQPEFCATFLSGNQTLYSRLKESSALEDFGDSMTFEEPWLGPICQESCLSYVDNETRCANESIQDPGNLTCFLRMDSRCNAHSSRYKAQSSVTTILASSVAVILIAASAVCATLFVSKRRKDSSIDTSVPQQHISFRDEEHLIHGEADSVSL